MNKPIEENYEKLLERPSTIFGRHEFDALFPPVNSRLTLVPARLCDVPDAMVLAGRTIGGHMAASENVERVIARNPSNITLFQRDNRTVGICALLMLTTQGLEALLVGDLIPQCPDLESLAPSTETPAAIYVWAIIAPGLASAGIRHMSPVLRQPKYAKANLFTRPATIGGARIIKSTGFKRIQSSPIELYRYVRLANRRDYLANVA